ncbi:MAG: sigma-54-dependent Fis family transcriptional regulator, partial [Gammaproteobacteria bacterium]|nr:sigma-54-dependent Fis family transcriptional regulator [Gammaproteobacteria bacterium]
FRNMYALDKVPFTLDKEAENCLLDYSFPGNVRELRNIVIRLCAKYPGKTVDVEALREELESMVLTLTTKEQQDHTEAVQQELLESAFRLDDKLKTWESRYITTALAMSGGNLSKAARLLGINRTTLYSRVQRLSIEAPE